MCVPILEQLLVTTTFCMGKMADGVKGDFSNATDVADYLVRRGVPFRSAHGIAGRMVHYCEEKGKTFADLTLDELKEFSDKFESTRVVGGAKESIEARDIPGSTAPARIREQIEAAKQTLD
jgi:argininosuccinate lyase